KPLSSTTQPVEHLVDDQPIVELQLFLPQELTVNADVAARLLLSFSACRFPVSFEIIGTAANVVVQIACRAADAQHITEQLQAHLPECYISETLDYLSGLWLPSSQPDDVIIEFGLANSFYLPLRVVSGFTPDPLVSFIGCLSELTAQEI